MIIIHGGKNQGQEAVAESLKKAVSEGSMEGLGFEKEPVIIRDFYSVCRSCFEKGGDPVQMCRERYPDCELILVTREIGNGIIPLEKSDREFREFYGRLMVELAAEARAVFRVLCGIPQRIK